MAKRPAAIRGAPRRWSGKRPTRPRNMAIGDRSCRSSIAGRMTTACPAHRRTSYRKTCRPMHQAASTGRDGTARWKDSSVGIFQKLTEKSWLVTDRATHDVIDESLTPSAAPTGLRVYFAVATVMFLLVAAMYLMRMGLGHIDAFQDWRP